MPVLRDRLPDVPEPAPLHPEEERFRLLDAVSQFLVAISERQPVVLVIDDLHWAERGTIAMLCHVARFASKHRTLIVGAYRDVELDRQHPLAEALTQLRREVEYDRIPLKGLDEAQVATLLSTISEYDVPEAFVRAISDETDGNPFFIREVLIHLADEGKIFQRDGRWTSDLSASEMGIPEGVRQVAGACPASPTIPIACSQRPRASMARSASTSLLRRRSSRRRPHSTPWTRPWRRNSCGQPGLETRSSSRTP